MYSHTKSRAVPIKLLKRDHGDVSPHPYGNSNNMKIHLKQFQNTCYTKHQEIFAKMWIVYIWCQLCWILCLGCSQVLSGFTICANCNVKLFPKRFQISHYFLQSIRKVTRFDNLSYVYDAEKWTDKNQKQKGHRKHLKNYLKLWFKQSEYYIFLQSACIHSQCMAASVGNLTQWWATKANGGARGVIFMADFTPWLLLPGHSPPRHTLTLLIYSLTFTGTILTYSTYLLIDVHQTF